MDFPYNPFNDLINEAFGFREARRPPGRLPRGVEGFDRHSNRMLVTGTLPHTGVKTTLPLLREDEIPLMGKPYFQWSPVPIYPQTSVPFQEDILATVGRFSVTRPCHVDLLLARIWQGRTPMSNGRWKAKKLDNWRYYKCSYEYMVQIVKAFQWLNHPEVMRLMWGHLNTVADKLDQFQRAINARRTRMNVEEKVDLKALWLQFTTSVFESMVSRTHNWVHDRFMDLAKSAQASYNAAVQERGSAASYDEAVALGECHVDLLRVLERADYSIMISLSGFKTFAASPSDSKIVGSLSPLPYRQGQRDELKKAMPYPVAARIVDDLDGARKDAEAMNASLNESFEMYTKIRQQLRGERTEIAREHWINIIHSRTKWSLDHGGPQDQQWGFVAYLITRTPTQEQWEAFFSKLLGDLSQNGDGVEGFAEVKDRMALQFIDSGSSGIPHDDIEAAKQWFRNSPNMRRRNWKEDFLVIDTECFNSYMYPSPSPSPLPPTPPGPTNDTIPSHGDFGGFLKLIDIAVYPPGHVAETAPGYKHELKVLGSLVFEDLYPLLNAFIKPKELWVEAMLHPQQVYVGYSTETQAKGWEVVWKTRGVMCGALAKWVARSSAQR
ncbi:hypothetical protein DM02DRAFT_731499 [Periconia macrospinosa]|uniref:Uncharacterized protein n=1 Tax=Periconia macrospinosa TaxID=97972 RepID=A0A2V1DD20_9PLEO|nr:hypothetical protein DM02DRAFT_731499 [Periconia macrospinosa]